MNISEEIRTAITELVAKAKRVRLSYSGDGGITTTTLSGEAAVQRITELFEKAEISKIKIMWEGKEIASFPFVGGALAATAITVFAFPLALFGAAAFLVADCDVEIVAEQKK